MQIQQSANRLIIKTGYADEFLTFRLFLALQEIAPANSATFKLDVRTREGLVGAAWRAGGLTGEQLQTLINAANHFDTNRPDLGGMPVFEDNRQGPSERTRRRISRGVKAYHQARRVR